MGALFVDKDLDYCRTFCNVCFFPRLKVWKIYRFIRTVHFSSLLNNHRLGKNRLDDIKVVYMYIFVYAGKKNVH